MHADSLRCRCFSRLASKISNACAAVLMAGSSHHPAVTSSGHQLLLLQRPQECTAAALRLVRDGVPPSAARRPSGHFSFGSGMWLGTAKPRDHPAAAGAAALAPPQTMRSVAARPLKLSQLAALWRRRPSIMPPRSMAAAAKCQMRRSRACVQSHACASLK